MPVTGNGVKTYYDAHFYEGTCQVCKLTPPVYYPPVEPPTDYPPEERARIELGKMEIVELGRVAALGHLGQSAELQRAVQDLLRVKPDFCLDLARQRLFYVKNDDQLEIYLAGLRALCDERGALLIFDEIITGLRVPKFCVANYYKVIPDLILFGKALAGGMPLAAIGGKAAVLDGDYFVSSTFAGETASLAAATAVVDSRDPDRVFAGASPIGVYRSGARTAQAAPPATGLVAQMPDLQEWTRGLGHLAGLPGSHPTVPAAAGCSTRRPLFLGDPFIH